MGKEKEQLEIADKAVPDRGTDSSIPKGATIDLPAAKASALRLAPASEDSSAALKDEGGLQFTPASQTGRQSNASELLQLAPSGESQYRRGTSGGADEEVPAPTASEAFEAYIPGERKKLKRNQPKSHDNEDASPVLVDDDNVKVEADDSARRQLHRLSVVGALAFLLVALVVGVSVGVTQQSNSKSTKPDEPTISPSTTPSMKPSFTPTSTPSSAPTITRFQLVADDLALDFGPVTMLALQNFSSPQSRAARWIIEEDEAFMFPLNETDPESQLRRRFRQRYALATLYFSTGGDTSWKTQGAFLSPTLHECDWGSTGVGNETLLSCSTQCESTEVHGLTEGCDDELLSPIFVYLELNSLVGRIPPELGALTGMIGMNLHNNALTGSLPEEIYNLRYLGVLSLSYNQITGSLIGARMSKWSNMVALSVLENEMTGTLPSEMSALTRLRSLDLSNNFFSGTIPVGWPQSFTALKLFSLSNDILTGPLPPSMEKMTKLELLFLAANGLNGTLPTELAAIPTFRILGAYRNQFSGTFPKEFAMSKSMAIIQVENNHLAGAIPSTAWLESRNLTQLRMFVNDFSGTIPSELGSLSGLEALTVGGSNLAGTIPTELGNVGSMTYLLVAKSPGIQGKIPTELGMLQNLTDLQLSENDLSGTIPSQVVGASPSLALFSVWSNPRLVGTLPDSMARISPKAVWLELTNMTGNASVICDHYQPDFFTADCLDQYCPCCTLCYVDGAYYQAFDVYTDRRYL